MPIETGGCPCGGIPGILDLILEVEGVALEGGRDSTLVLPFGTLTFSPTTVISSSFLRLTGEMEGALPLVFKPFLLGDSIGDLSLGVAGDWAGLLGCQVFEVVGDEKVEKGRPKRSTGGALLDARAG